MQNVLVITFHHQQWRSHQNQARTSCTRETLKRKLNKRSIGTSGKEPTNSIISVYQEEFASLLRRKYRQIIVIHSRHGKELVYSQRDKVLYHHRDIALFHNLGETSTMKTTLRVISWKHTLSPIILRKIVWVWVATPQINKLILLPCIQKSRIHQFGTTGPSKT